MERRPITKSTDGGWNLQPTISCSNGYQKQEKKLLTASPEWSNYQTIAMPQSQCSQPPIWMDQHSTQESKHHNIKQPKTQDLQTLHQSWTLLHLTEPQWKLLWILRQNPLQPLHRKPYSRCRGQIHFCKCISKWLSNGKAPQHEADYVHTLKDYYTSTSWMQIRNVWPLPYS